MTNNQTLCLISDSRNCKVSGVTDEVFIIGSGSPEFKQDVEAILEVLKGFGFSGNFALLSEKSKGYDAFCDKICSKIREAQFCIALLNDPCSIDVITFRVPSPNVYYEFGLAVAQGKCVIPVIKRGLVLPFDVQHLDTIIYNDIDDLKIKLKAPIVAVLRKQKPPLLNNNEELQKQVYGPLYNKIDSVVSRTNHFSIIDDKIFNHILLNYKYLFDKINPVFQKEIRTFYDKIQEFNNHLLVAQKTIVKIVGTEVNRYFKFNSESTSEISIEITGETGSKFIPTLGDMLLWKIKPEQYFTIIENTKEKVIKTEYFYKRPGYPNRRLNNQEILDLILAITMKAESNLDVVKLRKDEKKIRLTAKKLLADLKQML